MFVKYIESARSNNIARQIFTLLELQYKKKGLSFSKPPTDTHGYMNIALLNALEFLEGLQDK
jgi:hypothetical protein